MPGNVIIQINKVRLVNQLFFNNPESWRDWLAHNHKQEEAVWLIFYKKDSGRLTMKYEDAVCQALCFGWIDSIIKKVDEQKYLRKFSPRRPGSKWSDLNKTRIGKLMRTGEMAKPGLDRVETAKSDGSWAEPDRPDIDLSMPADFRRALDRNGQAARFYQNLAASYRRNYLAWIVTAKRQETRAARIAEAVTLLSQNKKLGLK